MQNTIQELNKRNNEIFQLLFQQGAKTKKELQELLFLKPTTLNRTLDELIASQLVINAGEVPSTGGRKAESFSMNDRTFCIIGIEISRTTVRLLLINLQLDILDKATFDISRKSSPQIIFKKIDTILTHWLEKQSRSLLGIGVGTIGPLDHDKGTLLSINGFEHPDWKNLSIKELIEKKYNVPCFVDNGVNCAVLAENLFGIGKKKQRLAYIHSGIGIRSSVINNGVILRTLNDHEDALGNMHLLLQEETKTLEELCGLHTFFDNEETFSAPHLIQTACIEKKATIFGLALANFARLLNPEMMLLSGPSFELLPQYFEQVKRSFYTNYPEAVKSIYVEKEGTFEQDVIAVGAAIIVIVNEKQEN
ncbi:MAG TPA: ROK family protein [Candidatus Tetragenococcus pullicola]|nr:ROK family protein [Candidatus Tetragenococcus pullicola]